jgi:cellulose synthase operon protein C
MNRFAFSSFAPATLMLLSACGSAERVGTLANAQQQYAKGEYAAANVELMSAVTADPTNAEIHLLRARVFLRLDDGVAAEGEVAQARDLGANSRSVATLLVESALLQNDAPKAGRLIVAVGGQFEKPADEARLTGERMVLDRDFGGALQQFETALAQDAADGRIVTGIGHIQMLTGQNAKAEESAKRAIALSPDRIGAHVLAGRVAFFQQRYRLSLTHYNNALKLNEKNPIPIFGTAAAYGELDDAANMQKWVTRGLKLAPGYPYGLYLQAKLLANKGDIKQAYILMEQAGDGLADDVAATTFGGELAIKMGYTAKAIGQFENAIALAPQITHLQVLLANAQFANKEPAAALNTLHRFDAFNPQPAEVTDLKAAIAAAGGG